MTFASGGIEIHCRAVKLLIQLTNPQPEGLVTLATDFHFHLLLLVGAEMPARNDATKEVINRLLIIILVHDLDSNRFGPINKLSGA